MKYFKTINFSFDIKVKLLIIVCVCIAVIGICYAYYVICVNKGEGTKNNLSNNHYDMTNINNIAKINCYLAKYQATVNSNKNTNQYSILEDVDMLNNKYKFILEDNIIIEISEDNTKYINENSKTKETIIGGIYDEYNYISLSSVIKIINKILKGDIDGKIVKVEENGNVIFNIKINEENKKISTLEVIIDKSCKINEIKMYNNDSSLVYNIVYESLEVKK